VKTARRVCFPGFIAAIVAALLNPFSFDLLRGQVAPTSSKFQVDPFWPKPLPNDWVTGNVGGTCVDANDHLFIVTRTADPANLTAQEKEIGKAAPPVIEFDPDGNVVNSWGDPKSVPSGAHDCYFDYEGNIWIGGNTDAIAQKYSRDGKLLLQIGTKKKFDTTDGTDKGTALNASHTLLNKPASFAVDPANGEVYIADGYGNRRVAVFDRNGNYRANSAGRRPKLKTMRPRAGYFSASSTASCSAMTGFCTSRIGTASAFRFSTRLATLRKTFLLNAEERTSWATARRGGSCCRATKRSDTSTSPTVWTRPSGLSIARAARCCRDLAGSATWPVSLPSSIRSR
jgi:hypothetical protein